MKKIEAVIFDWAGTTVDFGSTAPVQAFIEAFGKFGIAPTLEEVREPMGMPKWDHIHKMMQMDRIAGEWEQVYGSPWTRADVDQVYKVSEEAIMEILPDFAGPKPYVTDTVKMLRGRGISIGSTTGYTSEMMGIVAPAAAAKGYEPDVYITPDDVGGKGRPYPYMIFRNLEKLGVSSVAAAIKVGDTVADIKEGKNAGLISVGIVEGSSVMGLTEEEYEALPQEEKVTQQKNVTETYFRCGADHVILNLSRLEELIDLIERR
ncbi:MAG TPA: phosphonoacetaldehyde hydrolase [Candidatus Copromorpha excrementipullorum]|uniref:Phosphonoacetaldehyde hydrolase n=1 Tax=Candidatus Allocopromorpha excrementipullorum TaxID=2840743 RepID=A0A9D1N7I0_9FIRM|nr:phosphonoacetaldehyde hydrolase [Candidatus Copromorpha excrementipullorum]